MRRHRMDELARALTVTRANSCAHQQHLRELIDADLLITDDFLTVGSDQNTTGDLFASLVSRDGQVPTMIASQAGPGDWIEAILDQVAADSIVNRLPSQCPTHRTRPGRYAGARRRRTPQRHHLLGVTLAPEDRMSRWHRYRVILTAVPPTQNTGTTSGYFPVLHRRTRR